MTEILISYEKKLYLDECRQMLALRAGSATAARVVAGRRDQFARSRDPDAFNSSSKSAHHCASAARSAQNFALR